MTALDPFGPEIWTAEGPAVRFFGFPYPTRMAVIRLRDGGLFVWSPVALDGALRAAVSELGPVRHLVSPNALHHLFLPQWHKAFPAARLWAPPGLARRRRDIAFTDALGNRPPPDWAADLDQLLFEGSPFLTETVFFHRASRTALFADLIQRFPKSWFKGWRGLVARLDGIVTPDYGPPREWRLSFLNRAATRRARDRILAWQAKGAIIAHGTMARHGGARFIRRGLSWV